MRADNLLTLLATLLQRRLEGRATLILIEDAHWFDTASWALALELAGLVGEGAGQVTLAEARLALDDHDAAATAPQVGEALAQPPLRAAVAEERRARALSRLGSVGQLGEQQVHRRPAGGGIDREAAEDRLDDVGRHRAGPGGAHATGADRLAEGEHGGAGERRLAEERRIEGDAERELIGGGVDGSVQELLRRHVCGRAEQGAGASEPQVEGRRGAGGDPRRRLVALGLVARPRPRPREAEVEHADPSVVADDRVAGLEVAVDQAGGVGRREAAPGVAVDREDLVPGAGLAAEPAAEVESIQLSALSPEDSAALLGARLGLAELPDELARRAFEWTHGTPFFIEQVALALLEAGLVRQQGPRVVVVAGEAELAAFQVPGSVEALILRRLDRLAPAAREALNLAAALGRAVARDELEALLHRVDPALDGPRALEALLAAGLLVRPPHDPGGLTFPHALAQKAIYEQTQPSVRRRFHEIIATWYEEHERAHAPDRLGVLAHHWTHAALPDKAVVYLAQAGEQAFLAFASREAITYLNEALAANDRLARPLTAATRARWHQMLGEAHVKLGEYHAARRHLAQSLRHLGYRPPGATLGVVLGVLGHLLRQLFNRLAPTAMVRSSEV